jgi:putative ABC transport system permease protein
MIQDFRFALRSILKSPAFSILAIITLAIGIGMNTAIFSLFHDLFLRGLPFENPSGIIRVYGEAKERSLRQLPFSIPRYWHYRDAQTVFSETAADSGTGFILTGMGDPIQLNGDNVTANYFHLLGVKPILGRLFLPEEEMKADVAVISEHFWRAKLGGDPNVLGRSLTLNGVPTTIIGVVPRMPISWFGPDCEICSVKPFDLPGTPRDLLMRGVSFMRMIGRLKPGGTVEQARANLSAVQESYHQQNAEKADTTWEPILVTAPEDATGQLRPAFLTLLGAVAFVLLIACSNVANLLLVRFAGRRREIALRVALGASRTSIVRLFVIESSLLSLMAAVLGIFLALWALPLVPKLAGQNVPLEAVSAVNGPALAFTLFVSLAVGLAMGVYPALQSARSDLVHGLKDGGRAISGSAGQNRFRRSLVAAQVCLSVVLLAGAGLLTTSFLRLTRENAGFRVDRIWVGGIGLPPARYPDKDAYARFAKRLQDELQNAPGVEAVALTDSVALTGAFSQAPYTRADRDPVPMNQRPLGLMHSISPGYLQTFGMSLIVGRNVNEYDKTDGPPVVLISQATAKRLFPGENPIGHQMYFGTNNGTGLLTEIVGIVSDVRFRQLDKTDDVEFYRPISQRIFPFVNICLRTTVRPEAIAGTARAALDKIDRELPIIQPTTMTAVMDNSLGPQRLTTTLLGIFAGVALLLALIGIYGAVAYTVAQRTGEIGVRMALGAQARDVLQLVLSQGMKPVLFGLAAGVVVALALGWLLTSQLYQVSAYNPALLAGTTISLATVALAACFIPARRATQVSPIVALRYE